MLIYLCGWHQPFSETVDLAVHGLGAHAYVGGDYGKGVSLIEKCGP